MADPEKLFSEDLIKGSGVEYLKVIDPYQLEETIGAVKEADRVARSENGGVSVIIARHPCLVSPGAMEKQKTFHMEVTEDCVECQVCIKDFECPAMILDETSNKAKIDPNLCSGCGVCVDVCPTGAIKRKGA
jgi:indolepyruvate ferredoxin oxidoreductase alpha subunit